LRARSPRFLELLEPTVEAAALSGVLAEDEGYVRIVLTRRGSYGVLVTKTAVTPYRIELTEGRAAALAKRLHDGNLIKRNRLAEYDVEAGAQLYAALFGPLAEQLAGLKRLQIDAGGPLAAVPFTALVTAPPSPAALQNVEDDQDYRAVSWFGRQMFLAQSVGPAPFVRMRAVAHAPGPVKAAIFGDFSPAPQLVAQRLAAARGLSDACRDEVQKALQRLQALPDTAGEAQRTAALFTGAARTSLGAQFTDRSFLEDPSVTEAGVIMLATHGVLGLSSCFAEPALLASVGDSGDGLIEASELLDRRLQARLVVLSACDTAGGGRADAARTGLSDGGEALSGLARAFLYAGASSVLATQWKVDAEASGTEIQAFFAAALKEGRPISEALAHSQTVLLKDAETSHPFYWAPFAIIGDGSTTLASPPLSPAKVAALP
jgi:CHAT domain-containing protein